MITPAYQRGFKVHQIHIDCQNTIFSGIPELKAGTFDGISYFDATAHQPNFNVDQFVQDSFCFIKNLQGQYHIDNTIAFAINHDNHVLVHVDLLLLYMMYVDVNFMAYMFEQFNVLINEGVCVSDSYLLNQTISRIPLEVLNQAYAQQNAKSTGV